MCPSAMLTSVEALAAWAKAQRVRKGTRLGGAITYLKNQWEGLVRFLEEPRVPLSNLRPALSAAPASSRNFSAG